MIFGRREVVPGNLIFKPDTHNIMTDLQLVPRLRKHSTGTTLLFTHNIMIKHNIDSIYDTFLAKFPCFINIALNVMNTIKWSGS
jgi:hypothetical protein